MKTHMSNILIETGTNEAEILEIFIDEESYRGYYGMNVAKVLEIIPLPKRIIKPPNTTSPFTVGLFNHREKIVALIDLAKWLGRTRVEKKPPNVLITEFNSMVNAFLVSGVTRIHRITWNDIRPMDGYMEGLSESITGVVELEGKIVLLLDLEKTIADLNPDLAVIDSTGGFMEAQTTSLNEPIRILHADDSGVVRRNVKRLLEENNHFLVESVINGEEAWAHLLNVKKRVLEGGCKLHDLVDVVLTDIEMPGMDGYYLCKLIKEDEELSSLPVVLFSSLITDRLLHKGQSVGADGQFAKPDLALVSFIRESVEKRRSGNC
ncbi:chemotaxis protein [Syntrophorhabdus aromaticivorans]|jgi:two-component system chemotaxis response regulator CheV|uniref:chemotaxis protein n=1 Tax=Syntrophorhabdus aromaticivorans TaxID=328301 RepID=UPI0003F67631|nr:chemotaxis protein [Syntrophorhabdus aromaticivorans]